MTCSFGIVFMENNNSMAKRQETLPTTSGLAKLGGKVIIRTLACPLTVSDNPNGVQLLPNFAKPPGRCAEIPSGFRRIARCLCSVYSALRDFVHLLVLLKAKPFAKPAGVTCKRASAQCTKA